MFRALSFVVMGLAMLLGAVGCSSDTGPKALKQVAVKGTVTLDGAPMESGEIMFVQSGQVSTLQVTNGAFAGQAPVGDSVVQIYAYSKDANVVEMGGQKVELGKQNFLPAQFNAASTLKASVPAAGATDLKYEVTSK